VVLHEERYLQLGRIFERDRTEASSQEGDNKRKGDRSGYTAKVEGKEPVVDGTIKQVYEYLKDVYKLIYKRSRDTKGRRDEWRGKSLSVL